MSFEWHEIHESLVMTTNKLSFHKSFQALRHGDPALGRFTDPAALLDMLHARLGCAERKNRILRTLVAAAQSDGPASDCALTLALLALWPGLGAVRRRLLWRKAGRSDEVSSEVLARATETLRGLDLDRVGWIAATVLRNIERDALRAHCRDAARALVAAKVEAEELAAPTPGAEAIFLRRDLGRLVGCDANLVLRVAVDGFTQREIAGALGLSEAAAQALSARHGPAAGGIP